MNLTLEQQKVVNNILSPDFSTYEFELDAWTAEDEDFFCEDALYWLQQECDGYENLNLTYDGENDDEVSELRGEFCSALGREHTSFTNLSQLQKDIITSSMDAGCRTISQWWGHCHEKAHEFMEKLGLKTCDIHDKAYEEGWEAEWLELEDKLIRALWGFDEGGYFFKNNQHALITT